MKKKKITKILVIVLIIVSVLLGTLTTSSYLILKKNIVGEWSREVYHNEQTDEYIGVILSIRENGRYVSVSYNETTGEVGEPKTGIYKITPFKIRLIDDNKFNGEMVCKYNFITNTFKNGKLKYTKLQDE